MPSTVQVYSLAEMMEQFPEGYKRILQDWEEMVYLSEAPWACEIRDSLSAVIEACGGELTYWGDIEVSNTEEVWFTDETGEEDYREEPKGPEWLMREVLSPNGYVKDGEPYFPGNCVFTGYCTDDDLLEKVNLYLRQGHNLSDALRMIVDDADAMNEADKRAEAQEERLHEWKGEGSGCAFFPDGTEV